MKITILTQYYPPETGAPQNRLSDLARRLKKLGHEVVVLTAMPNYPGMRIYPGYSWKLTVKERVDGIPVIRSCIFVSRRRSVFFRLLNYLSFVLSSCLVGVFRLGKADILVCESPPLFLGISGWLLARAQGAAFVFNVSDLWPESALKLGIVTHRALLSLAYKLEAFLYRKAALVTGQTRGICTSIQERFPTIPVAWFPNGVDPDELAAVKPDPEIRTDLNLPRDALVVIYGGIIGHAQGLDIVLRAAPEVADAGIVFLLAGDGPEREALEHQAREHRLDNVRFLGHLARERMVSILAASDVALVPLRKLDLFKGALPSKLFEALAMGKPLLLGVDGEARVLFIDQARAGYFYEPENATDLVQQLRMLRSDPAQREAMGERGRAFVSEHFNRSVLVRALADRLARIGTSERAAG